MCPPKVKTPKIQPAPAPAAPTDAPVLKEAGMSDQTSGASDALPAGTVSKGISSLKISKPKKTGLN